MSFEIRDEELTEKDDFGGVDLVGVSFINNTMVGTLFESGSFTKLNFKENRTSNISFKGSEIKEGYFENNQLFSSNFSESKLDGVGFIQCEFLSSGLDRLDMTDSYMSESSIKGSWIREAKITSSTLKNFILSNSHIKDSTLTDVDFRSTEIKNSVIESSSMKDISFPNLKGKELYFQTSYLRDIVFTSGGLFEDFEFKNCTANFISFENFRVKSMLISDCTLTGNKIIRSNFLSSGIFNSTLKKSFWSHSPLALTIDQTTFNELTVRNCNLDLTCVDVYFQDCTFEGMVFGLNTILKNVTFDNCTFYSSCKLNGVDLSLSTFVNTHVPDSIK